MFVLAIILSGGIIHRVVPYKLAFLNLYAVPVLMAAYSLDLRSTLFGAFACVLLTAANVYVSPTGFLAPLTRAGLAASLTTWGCLLVLCALLVERMKTQFLDSELRRRELDRQIEHMRELEEVKDHFMRSVTHDLKAPLNAIQAYAQLMLSGQALTPAQQRRLGIINTSTQDLARFIDEILDFAKLQSGRMPFEKAPASIGEILTGVHDLQKANAEKFGIALKLSLQDGLPPVVVDRAQVARVVTNLVFNAFKFTPEGGTVEVSAARQGGDALLVRVRDSGVGIPKEKLESIFDQYFQVADTRKKARTTGTGLGLGIAKEIVEKHGGRIWADSDGKNGTELSFTLPLDGAPREAA